MNHVMLDLETLGLRVGSAILSIGAVRFDPHSDALGQHFHQHIKLESCVAAGLVIQPSTMLWWLQQELDARSSIVQGQETAQPLGRVLGNFEDYLAMVPGTRVWAWGSNMDLALLSHAYDILGSKRPWYYRDVRCARTVHEEFGANVPRVEPATAHDALADAIAAAQTVQAVYHATVFDRSAQ